MYCADNDWLEVHLTQTIYPTPPISLGDYNLPGGIWSADVGQPLKKDINYLKVLDKPGLSTRINTLHSGSSSGYQAINLSYLLGWSRALLLGFDMRASKESHFFGRHKNGLRDEPFAFASLMIPKYRSLIGLSYPIINCTEDSALDFLPFLGLKEALNAA